MALVLFLKEGRREGGKEGEGGALILTSVPGLMTLVSLVTSIAARSQALKTYTRFFSPLPSTSSSPLLLSPKPTRYKSYAVRGGRGKRSRPAAAPAPWLPGLFLSVVVVVVVVGIGVLLVGGGRVATVMMVDVFACCCCCCCFRALR